MITELWKEIKNEPVFEGVSFIKAHPPQTNLNTVNVCRKLCRQNKCRSYNTNWGCPSGVGPESDAVDYINHFKHAAIIYRRFSNIDLKDLALIERETAVFQDACRRFANVLRAKKGVQEVVPLCSGACTYCGECSYPEPCRFPEQMVPSVSGFGIIMEDYIPSQGLQFRFEEDAFTLYGVILYI